MTLDEVLDEAIERYTNNAEYERTHGSLQGCLEFRQLAEWLKDYKRLLEQESCEDNIVEWKKDFKGYVNSLSMPKDDYNGIMEYIDEVPVTPQQKMGHREYNDIYDHYLCGKCKTVVMDYDNFCPNCGAKMQAKSDIKQGLNYADEDTLMPAT